MAWLALGAGVIWMRGPTTSVVDYVAIVVPATLLLLCGTIIVARTRVMVIGWLLVLPGAMLAWMAALEVISTRTVAPWPELGFTLLTPLSFLPIVLLVLVFPTGRFATRWLRILGVAATVALVGRAVMDLLAWLDTADRLDPSRTFTVSVRVVLVVALLGFVAQVHAYRRRSPVEQRQMKWFLLAVSSMLVYAPAVVLDLPGSAFRVADAASTSLFPLAILIAMTRHDLYEIDRILTRTVAYALVIGVLAATYGIGITILSNAFPSADNLTVAGATLGTVALFDPLRRRVVAIVTRYFNRTRYVAQQVIEAFGREVLEETDTARIHDDLAAVIATTLAPRSVGIWEPPPSDVTT